MRFAKDLSALPSRRRFLTALAASPLGGAAESAPGFRLADVTRQAGIHFQHNSGAFGKKYLPETLGPGCAFLDFDNDGWQDILLINGTDWLGQTNRVYQLWRRH